MAKRPVLSIVAGLFLAATGFPLAAHHSYVNSPFDVCQHKSIEGAIQDVAWNGPHVWLTVKTDDSTVYRVEWTGPANLSSQGIEAADLPVGGRVVVSGSPHLSSNALSLLTEVRVIGSDVKWSRSFSTAACPPVGQ